MKKKIVKFIPIKCSFFCLPFTEILRDILEDTLWIVHEHLWNMSFNNHGHTIKYGEKKSTIHFIIIHSNDRAKIGSFSQTFLFFFFFQGICQLGFNQVIQQGKSIMSIYYDFKKKIENRHLKIQINHQSFYKLFISHSLLHEHALKIYINSP